jgi:thymidine phosphorylase
MLLGAGREKVGDTIDPGAGIVVRRKPGEPVRDGDAVLELQYNHDRRLSEAIQLAEAAITIGSAPPEPRPLILGHVR